MDLELSGKRVLVTGAAGGLGASIARAFAGEGAHVAVHDVSMEAAEPTAAAIRGTGTVAHAVGGDLSTDDGAAETYEVTVALLGGLDVLVNNVGVFPSTDWGSAGPERWLRTLDVNVVSAVRMIRAALPAMRAQGWGRILNTGSSEAIEPLAHMPDYAASKAALHNLTVSLAKTLASSGVTANTVSPGVIATDKLKRFFLDLAAQRAWPEAGDWDAIERRVASEWSANTVGRLGRVEEVAAVYAFLASPRAGFFNGSIVRIDGGFVETV